MRRYLAARLLQSLVVILLVSVGTFGMMHLVPGDPVHLLLGESGAFVTTEVLENIRAHWGLDRPWYEQFLSWFGNMLRGDMGQSMVRRGVPVSQMILEAAWVTLQLNVIATALAIAVALPAGIRAAVRRYTGFDYLVMVSATLGIAVPNFWLSLMLIILFALMLGWLPPFGLAGWRGWLLPVVVLATEQTALFARMMRASTIESLSEDYVRTARAKGLGERRVVYLHVLRNALLPVVTVLGYRLAFILSGTIVVETVFALPGLGQLFFSSVIYLDYQVIQAIVLLFTVLVVIGNLVTDLTYALIDPRIRLQ
jgi:ABC-type dipeptide/oligopeptide/nickel transport system permease component